MKKPKFRRNLISTSALGACGHTVRTFAKACNVSEQSMRNYQSGASEPGSVPLARISLALLSSGVVVSCGFLMSTEARPR